MYLILLTRRNIIMSCFKKKLHFLQKLARAIIFVVTILLLVNFAHFKFKNTLKKVVFFLFKKRDSPDLLRGCRVFINVRIR